jgi:hypothetical protein
MDVDADVDVDVDVDAGPFESVPDKPKKRVAKRKEVQGAATTAKRRASKHIPVEEEEETSENVDVDVDVDATPEEELLTATQPSQSQSLVAHKKSAATAKKAANPKSAAFNQAVVLPPLADTLLAASPFEDQMDESQFFNPTVVLPPSAEHDFFIKIPFPQAFKMMVEIIGHVLADCQFFVESEANKFSGLRVDCVDEHKTCMVVARFGCEVRTRGTNNFNIKVADLNTLLKNVKPKECVEIFRMVNQTEIFIKGFDPSDASQYQEFNLSTFNKDDDEQLCLDDLKSDYLVEIELNEFRSIVKTAKDLRAGDIRFTIYEHNVRGGQRSSYFVLSIDGENAKCSKVYHSLTQWEDSSNASSSIVIKTCNDDPRGQGNRRLPPRDELTTVLDDAYNIGHLTNFLAAMKANLLSLRLSSKGQPMVLKHPLGNESHISFVLAPRVKDQ